MPDNQLRERGVIYYATGQKYLKDAEESARSLKEHNNLHITVFTDVDNIETEVFDNIEKIDPGEHPFYDRINYFKKSPYQKTLHLDTDTYITGDITPIFEMLNRFDVVARIDPFRNTAGPNWGKDTTEVEVPDSFPEYQCGVIGFLSNSKTKTFFEDWQERYSEHLNSDLIDQPFFRESIYHSEIRIGTLPSEYNLLVNNLNSLQSKAKILHFNGGFSERTVIGSGRKKKELAELVNKHSPSRRTVFADEFNRVKIVKEPGKSSLLKLVDSIRQDGLKSTFDKVFSKVRRSIY